MGTRKAARVEFPGDRQLLQLSIHIQVSAHKGSFCWVYEKKQATHGTMHGLKLIQYQLGMTRRQPQAQEEKEQEKEEEDRRVTSPLVGLVNDDFCVAEVTVGPPTLDLQAQLEELLC